MSSISHLVIAATRHANKEEVSKVHLDRVVLKALLPMYRDDSVFAKEALLDCGLLKAKFDTFEHPFSKPTPKHFTREHALVFVTQGIYVLISLLADQEERWPIDGAEFRSLALNEQVTLTRIELNFRKFMKNRNDIELSLRCDRLRIIGNRIHAFFSFEFGDGCFGMCEGIVSLDASLNPGAAI